MTIELTDGTIIKDIHAIHVSDNNKEFYIEFPKDKEKIVQIIEVAQIIN